MTLAELIDKLERACAEKEGIERRYDEAVAELWLVSDEMVALNKKMASFARLIPGVLGRRDAA